MDKYNRSDILITKSNYNFIPHEKNNYISDNSSDSECFSFPVISRPIVIIKKLPTPDINIDNLEMVVSGRSDSRNRVFFGRDIASGMDVIIKFYEKITSASTEIAVLQALQDSPFKRYLPSVRFFTPDAVVEARINPDKTTVYDCMKVLAQLHTLNLRINGVPAAECQDADILLGEIEYYRRLGAGKVRSLRQTYGWARDELIESPIVLIHGDPKPENWVGSKLVDWESASYGPAEKDLARMLIDPRLAEQEVVDALYVYQKAVFTLQGKSFDKDEFIGLIRRFEAARFIETLRKLRTNVQKQRRARKVEYLANLIQA